MRITLSLISLLVFINGFAQDTVKWATPNVKGQPVGHGLYVGYKRVMLTTIETTSEVGRLNDSKGRINGFSNVEYDLKFPIVLKDRTQLIGSFEYTYDFFQFDTEETETYEFYDIIDRTELKSRKFKFYVQHSINDKKYINIRASAALNGDVRKASGPLYDFAKYSLSFVYGWQKTPYNAYGLGLYLGYTLGRPIVYPVFEWNKTLNDKWGFESKLPAKFLMRFSPNSGMNIYGGYQVEGLSYRLIDENQKLPLNEFELRRSDITAKLCLEKRLYDFLWTGVEAGLNYNLRMDASDGDKIYNEKELLTSRLSTAPYFLISIFIIPTESLKKFVGVD